MLFLIYMILQKYSCGKFRKGVTMTEYRLLNLSLEKLGEIFARRDWAYRDVPSGDHTEKSFAWPGEPDENIMICVHKGRDIQENFHRQDFFFLNFAYKGDYGAISYRHDNHVVIHENECYIGQPFTGYALTAHSREEIIIIGILIRKETFFRTFLPVLSADARLFHFFLNPQADQFSDEFLRLKFDEPFTVRTLLEMMVIEYAHPQEDTQAILQPMVLTLLMQIARRLRLSAAVPENETLSDRIIRYMGEHTDAVTLKDIANHFSYHPNYISSLLHQETGKTFSEILLGQRMSRAITLLENTSLSIEEIALMLGYSNSSNFYKAFRKYFGRSPREYAVSASDSSETFHPKSISPHHHRPGGGAPCL